MIVTLAAPTSNASDPAPLSRVSLPDFLFVQTLAQLQPYAVLVVIAIAPFDETESRC